MPRAWYIYALLVLLEQQLKERLYHTIPETTAMMVKLQRLQ